MIRMSLLYINILKIQIQFKNVHIRFCKEFHRLSECIVRLLKTLYLTLCYKTIFISKMDYTRRLAQERSDHWKSVVPEWGFLRLKRNALWPNVFFCYNEIRANLSNETRIWNEVTVKWFIPLDWKRKVLYKSCGILWNCTISSKPVSIEKFISVHMGLIYDI